jgi:3-phenylpropionate/trans-cinnamate dioxygenase ferredoxin reductase subunit
MASHYQYLIVGGGMTADAAVRGIRKVDSDGTIGLVSAEPDPPYNRPPLSKKLWAGKSLDMIWRNTESLGVSLHLERKAIELVPRDKRLRDDQGDEYSYGKLLLATGGKPRRLPFGGETVIYYRLLRDYKRLRKMTESGRGRFFVIGGGFIGSEIAAALAMNGQKVMMAFPERAIGALNFPPDLAQYVNDYYLKKGVEVLAGDLVSGIERDDGGAKVRLQSGRLINVDSVIAGIGIQPNVALAESAGLKVEDGILVDEGLRTSDSDIFAAGDVASFYNPALDRRMRVEHEDNANTMGEMAGRAMAGERVTYHHLPYFYSDLFELGYEAVGEMNAEHETFSDWQEPFQKGVVYYLKEGRLRGVLLWNVWGKVDEARKLIAEKGPFKESYLRGRIRGWG